MPPGSPTRASRTSPGSRCGSAAGAALTRLREAGATIAGVRLASSSPGHHCEQLAALRDLAGDYALTFEEKL
ncbi:hypothetical protein [Spirillospora sp. NPDC048823]